jgi:hypothetical protein
MLHANTLNLAWHRARQHHKTSHQAITGNLAWINQIVMYWIIMSRALVLLCQILITGNSSLALAVSERG